MKKMVVYALTAIMSVSVSVYGSEEESASKDAAEKSYDTKDLDSITNALEKEFEDSLVKVSVLCYSDIR